MPSFQPRAAMLCAWWSLAFWSFLIHGVWELFQCALFYDMCNWPLIRTVFVMLGSLLADVILTLLLVGAVYRQQMRFLCLDCWEAFALPFLGAFVASGIEILALMVEWWRYSSTMPEIVLAGFSVGLYPVLQMALVPLLCAKLARKPTLVL